MRKDIAIKNFYDGYNCAQAVVKAFEDVVDIDSNTLLMMVSPLGGGLSRTRETCGAISTMALVIGYFKGYKDLNDFEAKKEVYEITQSLIKEFIKRNKYMTCRELLKLDHKMDDPTPSVRNEEFYGNRPCAKFIGDATEILEDYLKRENLL